MYKLSVVHLSNQDYSICIRKDAQANRVCYNPCRIAGIANDVTDQVHFKHPHATP